MNSNSESHSSVHTYRVPLSIRSETREKFDALLKAAQRKSRQNPSKSESKEQLLLESTTASSENLQEVAEFELSEKNKNYILNKFLHGQGRKNVDPLSAEDAGPVDERKPPIPKPRRKKTEAVIEMNPSPTSQGTFEVTSPKVVKNTNDLSVSTNKTYNVEEIGDVVIHQSPHNISKTVIKAESSAPIFLEKGEVETLSDTTSSRDDKISSKVIESDLTKTEISEDVPRGRERQSPPEVIDKELRNLKGYKYEKIVEITVHKTDRLQLNSLVIHPVVKIHVVDLGTGKYLQKSDKNRAVVFFYENKDYDYISPVITHTCNLQEKRILFPVWEETILFNEDYEYFRDESHRIVLFFEILDFVSFTEIHQSNQRSCKKGWHHIAFAFLKLSAKNGVLNAGKRMRLQLYHSHQPKKEDARTCPAWTWWRNGILQKYPSTLYISFKSTKVPTTSIETHRSKTPVQRETSSKIKLFEDINKAEVADEMAEQVLSDECKEGGKTPVWSRTPKEPCKVPNKCLIKFDSGENGCFIMRFSGGGLYLACAVHMELFYIKIFSVQQLKEISKFPTNQGMIYDIKWSHDDQRLLCASADNTISVFNVVNGSFLQLLPHPSFVYSCGINEDNVVMSGCYDGILRIWNWNKHEFYLCQELEAHKGYITSTCFKGRCCILSADSTGVIIEWSKVDGDNWSFKREILLLDLKQTVINQIVLFPKCKKLLVHSRDSVLRIVDIKSGCVLQWLRGAVNKRFQTFCGMSPCGTYVYCGGEDGLMHTWSWKNGQEVASSAPYTVENKGAIIHCVECHPFDNVVAISHYGSNLPILLHCYDADLSKKEVEGITVAQNLACDEFRNVKSKCVIKGEKHDFKDILHKMDKLIKQN